MAGRAVGVAGGELLWVVFVAGAVGAAIWGFVDQRRYGASGGISTFVGIAMFSFFPLSLVAYLIWRALRAPADSDPDDPPSGAARRGLFRGVGRLNLRRAQAAIGMALAGGSLVLIGLVERSWAEVGLGLLALAIAAWGRMGREILRDHDGERQHGVLLLGLGLLLAGGAALIFIDDRVLELRYGFGLLWFVAPGSALAAVGSLAVGLRLAVAPKPNMIRDRRRRRPHRSPLAIADGGGGWTLHPVVAMHDPWPLPSHAVESIEEVGPPRQGAVRLRAELTQPLWDFEPPDPRRVMPTHVKHPVMHVCPH